MSSSHLQRRVPDLRRARLGDRTIERVDVLRPKVNRRSSGGGGTDKVKHGGQIFGRACAAPSSRAFAIAVCSVFSRAAAASRRAFIHTAWFSVTYGTQRRLNR